MNAPSTQTLYNHTLQPNEVLVLSPASEPLDLVSAGLTSSQESALQLQLFAASVGGPESDVVHTALNTRGIHDVVVAVPVGTRDLEPLVHGDPTPHPGLRATFDFVRSHYDLDALGEHARREIVAQEHALQQLAQLADHPSVKFRLKVGTLRLHAWVVDRDGSLWTYDHEHEGFRPIATLRAA